MEFIRELRKCQLFAGTGPEEMEAMLTCLSAKARRYEKRAVIYAAGDTDFAVGVVLEGGVDIIQEDYWGNQGILARLGAGELFAEAFALAQVKALPVSVVASEASAVLFLEYGRILRTCSNACAFHERLIANLLSIAAQKNIALTRKVEIVSKRTTREKLLTFLSAQAKRAGSSRFAIHYDRQALADYLAVDRSALSRELSAMRRDGLIAFEKNVFELKRDKAQ